MEANRPLFIPVILGTARMGRMSLHAARLVNQELGKRAGVETELIDIAQLPLPTNDAGEAIKHPAFSAAMVMRELGLVTIFWDVNFSSVQKVFAADGALLDDGYILRIDKFMKELLWMAKTLRH